MQKRDDFFSIASAKKTSLWHFCEIHSTHCNAGTVKHILDHMLAFHCLLTDRGFKSTYLVMVGNVQIVNWDQ